MNLLYLSCHSILEYDELRIFDELGLNIFSHGAYHNPQNPGDKKRPPLNIRYYKKFSENTRYYPKNNLDPELLKWADIIVVMHRTDWIFDNWEKIKNKRVILRTIGQNTLNEENQIRILRNEGVEVVRYSRKEQQILGYAGGDMVIRFGKKPEEYEEWTGGIREVYTVAQAYKSRRRATGYDYFINATEGYPRAIYGPDNQDTGDLNGGLLTYEDLKKQLKYGNIFFYTGTWPASYTLTFIEAAMTGAPMVALGNNLGNSPLNPEQKTYEVAELLKAYDAGITGDSIEELKNAVSELWNDEEKRKKFSKNIRRMARDFFDFENIKSQWKSFLML